MSAGEVVFQTPTPVDRMQTLVKILPWPNYVADGKNCSFILERKGNRLGWFIEKQFNFHMKQRQRSKTRNALSLSVNKDLFGS